MFGRRSTKIRDPQEALIEAGSKLMKTGADAVAKVIRVQDTGMMVASRPVVMLTLNVLTVDGERFETTGQSMVSEIAMPHAGDTIRIKYDPEDKSQLVVV